MKTVKHTLILLKDKKQQQQQKNLTESKYFLDISLYFSQYKLIFMFDGLWHQNV